MPPAAPLFSLRDGTRSPLVSFSLPPLSLRLARAVTGILLPAGVIKAINSNGKLKHAGLARCDPLTNLLINLRFPQHNYFPNFEGGEGKGSYRASIYQARPVTGLEKKKPRPVKMVQGLGRKLGTQGGHGSTSAPPSATSTPETPGEGTPGAAGTERAGRTVTSRSAVPTQIGRTQGSDLAAGRLCSARPGQPRAYLAFSQDVPQQREVLPGEVPKRFDLPTVDEGYQVEVIQLQRDTERGSPTRPRHLRASFLDKLGFVQESAEDGSSTPTHKHKYLLSSKGGLIKQLFSTAFTSPRASRTCCPSADPGLQKRCRHLPGYVGETEAPTQPHRITESQNSRGWKGPLWVI